MASEVWTARYPDLAGKVAVIAGTSSLLLDVARKLCDNQVTPAVIVDDRDLVTAATGYAEQAGVASMGVVADPTQRETWHRVAPHVEQRLGPIDIAVIIAPPAARLLVASVLMPDMAARRRGVIVEAGAKVQALDVPDGLRHRAVSAGAGVTAGDLAGSIVLCASDVLRATQVTITLAQRD